MTIYQVVTKGQDGGARQFRNIHYYEFFGYTPDLSQLQDLVDGVDAAYKTNLQGRTSTVFEYYGYDVRRVDIGDQPTLSLTPTAGAWNGTSTSDPLPRQVAGLVTFKAFTAFPRTSRTYIFGLTEADNTSGGNMASGCEDALDDWAEALLEVDIDGAIDADKQSVKFGGDPRAVIDANDLSTYNVSTNWATQRRRRQGVGI